jgi:hypothetical protein
MSDTPNTAEQAKHTPGPWEVGAPHGTGEADSFKQYRGKPYQETCDVIAREAGGTIKRVGFAYQGNGEIGSPAALAEQTANARLMAAAPELLAALKMIQAGFVDGSIKWAKPRILDSDPYHPANTAMCAAIAKAEGNA